MLFDFWACSSREKRTLVLLTVIKPVSSSQKAAIVTQGLMLEGAADNIIEVLPPEVIGEFIFSYLSPKEVVQSETVSKSWRCIAQDPLLWHSFCRRQVRQVF